MEREDHVLYPEFPYSRKESTASSASSSLTSVTAISEELYSEIINKRKLTTNTTSEIHSKRKRKNETSAEPLIDEREVLLKLAKAEYYDALRYSSPYHVGKLTRTISKIQNFEDVKILISDILNPNLDSQQKKSDSAEQELTPAQQRLSYRMLAELMYMAERDLREVQEKLEKVKNDYATALGKLKAAESTAESADAQSKQQAEMELNQARIEEQRIRSEKINLEKMTVEYDPVRFEPRTAVEAAIKAICVKLLITDAASIATYKPVLYPEFAATFMILLLDHFRRFYLEAPSIGVDITLIADEKLESIKQTWRSNHKQGDVLFIFSNESWKVYQINEKNEPQEKYIEPESPISKKLASINPKKISEKDKAALQTLLMKTEFLNRNMPYEISDEAFEALKNRAIGYAQQVADRCAPGFEKLMPSAMQKAPTAIYIALDRLNSGLENKSANNLDNTVKLDDGENHKINSRQVGQVALFDTMSGLREILANYINDLKNQINKNPKEAEKDLEQLIFSDEMLLRNSIEALMWDKEFFPLEDVQSKLNESQVSKAENIDFENVRNEKLRTSLLTKLDDDVKKFDLKDDEKACVEEIKSLIQNAKSLQSRECKKQLDEKKAEFKEKRIANRIRILLQDESFNALIKALSGHQLSPDTKGKDLNIVLDAIMNNNLKGLNGLSDPNLVKPLTAFVNTWGIRLRTLFPEGAKAAIGRGIIALGVFKEKALEDFQKKIKAAPGAQELPKVIEGLGDLSKFSDKLLVDFFRLNAATADPEMVKPEKLHELLYDADSEWLSQFESYLATSPLNVQFEALEEDYKGQKIPKVFNNSKSDWEIFAKKLAQLVKSKNFKATLEDLLKDKAFKKQFMAIVSKPDIYKKYDAITAFVFFKKLFRKLDKLDKEMLQQKGLSYMGHTYDTPTQAAAIRIREGAPDSKPRDSSSSLSKFNLEMIKLSEGEVKYPTGSKKPFYEVLFEFTKNSMIDFNQVFRPKSDTETESETDSEGNKGAISENLTRTNDAAIKASKDSPVDCLKDIQLLLENTDVSLGMQKERLKLALELTIDIQDEENIKKAFAKIKSTHDAQSLILVFNQQLTFSIKNNKIKAANALLDCYKNAEINSIEGAKGKLTSTAANLSLVLENGRFKSVLARLKQLLPTDEKSQDLKRDKSQADYKQGSSNLKKGTSDRTSDKSSDKNSDQRTDFFNNFKKVLKTCLTSLNKKELQKAIESEESSNALNIFHQQLIKASKNNDLNRWSSILQFLQNDIPNFYKELSKEINSSADEKIKEFFNNLASESTVLKFEPH